MLFFNNYYYLLRLNMPISVALSPYLEAFVRQQVESGRYNNVSEVIRAGLRLLEDSEKQQELKLQWLRHQLADGKASGSLLSAEGVFERLEAKYSALGPKVKSS